MDGIAEYMDRYGAVSYTHLLDEARAVEEAGAFAVVLECVPKALAKKITESISIPVSYTHLRS